MQSGLREAIFALDAYNRGAQPMLRVAGTRLAGYELLNIPLSEQSEAASFSASAYQNSKTGTVVIAYRGTDTSVLLGSDVLNGWSQGLGFQTPQARLAIEFYKSVVEELVGQPVEGLGLLAPDIRLTGHSLGGGLARYVGALYDQEALLFAAMPFEASARYAYDRSYGEDPMDPVLRDRIYGDDAPWLPALGNKIRGWAVTGEVLSVSRGLIDPLDTRHTHLDSHGGLSSPIDLHSMALHVALLWEKDNAAAVTGWESTADRLWDAFISDQIGLASGFSGPAEDENPRTTAGTKLSHAIAYSVIDEGPADGRPFGDVAIRAMFNDASDLGRAITAASFDAALNRRYLDERTHDKIVDMLMHNAGILAQEQALFEAAPVLATGIVHYDEIGGALTLDLRPQTLGDTTVDLVGKDDLLGDLAARAGVADRLASALQWFERNMYAEESGYDLIDALTIDIVGLGTADTAPAPSLSDTYNLHMFTAVKHGLDARQRGDSNDLILGTAQPDIIYGGGGTDILVGGEGSDLLIGGAGGDWISGGAGNDEIWGGAPELNDPFDVWHRELLDGGDGDDVLMSVSELDEIHGGPGNDYIWLARGSVGFYEFDGVLLPAGPIISGGSRRRPY